MAIDKPQSNSRSGPTRFWILGAGRFGRIAIERIRKRIPQATITVVDRRPSIAYPPGVAVSCREAIEWLDCMLNPDSPVDSIIPAIPLHAAAEWVKLRLVDSFTTQAFCVPDEWIERLPNALRGPVGRVYVSHADFICPDDCPEPKNTCTHTGRPRPIDLYRLIGHLKIGAFQPIVLRSHQLLPGVGGIVPGELLALEKTVRANSHRPIMIATACRCHGVIDFLLLEKKLASTRRS